MQAPCCVCRLQGSPVLLARGWTRGQQEAGLQVGSEEAEQVSVSIASPKNLRVPWRAKLGVSCALLLVRWGWLRCRYRGSFISSGR